MFSSSDTPWNKIENKWHVICYASSNNNKLLNEIKINKFLALTSLEKNYIHISASRLEKIRVERSVGPLNKIYKKNNLITPLFLEINVKKSLVIPKNKIYKKWFILIAFDETILENKLLNIY